MATLPLPASRTCALSNCAIGFALLEEVAQRSLDTVESPTRRDRFKLYFHFDIDGGGVDAGNARIPDSIRKYLTCDGSWNPIFTKNGLPLNAGRNERIVPDRLRRIDMEQNTTFFRDRTKTRNVLHGTCLVVDVHYRRQLSVFAQRGFEAFKRQPAIRVR